MRHVLRRGTEPSTHGGPIISVNWERITSGHLDLNKLFIECPRARVSQLPPLLPLQHSFVARFSGLLVQHSLFRAHLDIHYQLC